MSKLSILIKAIEVLSDRSKPITLQSLIDLASDPDDQLLASLGVLDPKHCEKLAENLQILKIGQQHLFPADCDFMNAELLFGYGAHGNGKTRLSIISTKFLGSDENIQFWVAQLLFELNRWCSREPSDVLQAVVMFDEADLYLPATKKPATKEPMESLLKRARSAGVSVFLATQSPGDLDYRCRDNINTWMIGSIGTKTAVEKIKPLLSSLKMDISSKLKNQNAGQFFLAQGSEVSRVQSSRLFLDTEQLSEARILELARKCRR